MIKATWSFIQKFSSPPHFYRISGKMQPWFMAIFIGTLIYGLIGGLYLAPTDYQQGDSFRIIYVHVPAAWMSMFIYMVMAFCAAVALIWRIKLADIVLISSAPIGAMFTAIALATGSIWGKPMWGTWWVWDARLTAELILLFLYLGIFALYNAVEDKRTGSRFVSILVLVGVVNIPIIHYSVEWWATLHQGPTVTKFDKPSIHIDMLIPLLVMAISFKCYYITTMFSRARTELLERESNAKWVTKLLVPTKAD
ncbi:MAG: heme ABC transporter permease [Gammaproteobacteria bacterium]|nr:heme ABC transporter permease [Gammaproteobacteria bacterium]